MSAYKTVFTFLLFLLGVGIGDSVLSAQCPMVCRQDFTVTLGNDGMATLTPDIVLDSSTEGCTEGFTIEIIDMVSGFVYGSVANEYMIGADLIFKVTDNATGNNCEGNLTVVDNTPPQIFVDTLFVNCNVDLDPEIIGLPNASDNVSSYDEINFDWFDQLIDYDCFTEVNGQQVTAELVRTWYAADEFGNIKQETQSIFYKRNTLADVQFPLNRDDISAPALACNESNPLDFSLTGQPTINGVPIDGNNDCDLITSFSDQETSVCGGATKIFRSWTVFDYCTNESSVVIQLIRLKDKIAPDLVCPPSVQVGTSTGMCDATVTMPQATASDNCSSFIISHEWEFGENESVYENIPVGTHFVTFKAKDACNNISACQTPITVFDDEVPTPVCKEHTYISLADSGVDILSAHTFNESSSDNCLIDRFEASKNGVDFYPALTFDCEDIPASPLSVYLRVFDTAGQYNDCAVEVSIDDYLKPELTCPDAITFDCFANINDLNISELAEASDNCGVADLFYEDDISGLNNCGFGTIFRLWIAEDVNGNISDCTQQINISDTTPASVNFPPDFITYDCSLKLNPPVTGAPEISGDDCEQILVFHTDDTIAVSDACLHIIRQWDVYNECVFNPNAPASGGYWTTQQTLKIYDSDAPELTTPPDITMFITGDDCQVYVSFDDATASDCSQAVAVSNNSFFSDNNEANASGFYPYGFYNITFTARDECDNVVNRNTILTVLDAQIPVVNCTGGFTLNLGTDGLVEPDPMLFDAGSYDNCSEDLTYLIFPASFTCEDRGEQDVLFQVKDESGNEANCWTTVVIQDNTNDCPDATLAGTLRNEEGEAISGKYVGLGGTVQMAQPTDSNGQYKFEGLPSGEYYTLRPTYDAQHLNGVTTNDIIQIRRHILGTITFPTPYKLLAADVNNSGTVTTADIIIIRRMILGDLNAFPANESWRFVPTDYEFIDPAHPFDEDFPEEIFIQSLNQNFLDRDFVAIKIGDVNGSANLTDDSGEERNREMTGQLPLYLEDIKIDPGFDIKVPFKAKDLSKIIGMQFSLGFDTQVLDFKRLELGNLPQCKAANFGLSRVEEGEINFSWDTHFSVNSDEDVTLFSLVFSPKISARLEEVLYLNKEKIQAEAYRGEFLENENTDFSGIELVFSASERFGNKLYQNYPNPVSGKANIGFYLARAGEVTLSVFDAEGNSIKTERAQMGQGEHEFTIDLSKTKAQSGILFYQLESAGMRSVTRKMIYTPLK